VRRFTIAAGVIIAALGPAEAKSLTCSTWNGIRTCSSPEGYSSTETQWQGLTTGQDSDGRRWTTSRWMGVETTTVERRPDR
jgi:hypothetical protein